MAHAHDHGRRAQALPPTLSLLRLSAAERLIGVAIVLAALWAVVALVIT